MNILIPLSVAAFACVPIVELKGAIPYGLLMGLPLWETFILAYIGSCVPAVFILFFCKPVFKWLKKIKRVKWPGRFAEWMEERSMKRSRTIIRFSYLGLFLFVAVPLPTTGIWTGSIIATLLQLRIKYALPVIVLANIVSGLLILLLSHYIIL